MNKILLVTAIATLSTTGLHAQPATQPPQISVSARGELRITPDRATIQLGVETRAKTAATAATENNRKQSAVLAAIRTLGIPTTQITTLGYTVTPMQHYDDKAQRTIIDGYQVNNIVQVTTDKVDQAGPVIDAALANGANRVANLDFSIANPAPHRDAALTQAVEHARHQADIAAKAAGGSLGELLELSIQDSEPQQPLPMLAMARSMDAAPGAPISEGTKTVEVRVNTRWRFVPR